MGAWIEISNSYTPFNFKIKSHPTMGAWIEISDTVLRKSFLYRRTPRWVRGLKFVAEILPKQQRLSHPTMGAWIEIFLQSVCL